MDRIFLEILNRSYTAVWLILAVIALRFVLKKAPKWIHCLLWLMVALRLVFPFTMESMFSLIPSSRPLPTEVITEPSFQVNTGFTTVDIPVNSYLEDRYFEGVTVPAGNGEQMMSILGLVWLTGIVLMLGYSLFSYMRLRRLTRISVRAEDILWDIAEEGEKAEGFARDVFQCDAIDTPFILGIFRPRIYLPSDMKETQASYVIAHEEAHLKRRDHLWKPLGFLILSFYWFHPLCWLSYILFCRDMEMACDEKTVKEMSLQSKKAYAEALLACSVKRKSIAACPLAFGEIGVKERIRSVLNYKKPAFWVVMAAAVSCVIVAVCFLTNPVNDKTGSEEGQITTAESLSEEQTENIDVSFSDTQQEGSSDAEGQLSASKSEDILTFLTKWASAFTDRNGDTIAPMASDELKEELKEHDLLYGSEAEGYGFGQSSPWPMSDDYIVSSYTENSAEIYYYAFTSDPHITCLKEEVIFEEQGEEYVMTDSRLIWYDAIASGMEFYDAYPNLIDNTPLDYTTNGLGEALNRNAVLSDSTLYQELFTPESAAESLLNLLHNPNKVNISRRGEESNGLVGLDITFLEDNVTVTISMRQPYGEVGIWVPANYTVDVLSRMYHADWEELSGLPYPDGSTPDMSGILCIGGIPEKDIKIYGYNDEEVIGKGVAIMIEGNQNLFDWQYTSPRLVMPNAYWDERNRQLQLAFHIYTGTGASSDALYVSQYYDTGTLAPSGYLLEDYTKDLEDRIGYRFDAEKKLLTLTDTETGEKLTEMKVPEGRVSGIEAGSISGFTLGDRIELWVTVGYFTEESPTVAEYQDVRDLSFEVLTEPSGSYGMSFHLGKVRVL